MPRIIKHPDLRRQELLDCAQAMFLERGYENASLNDVIAQAGSSKGAFYHYFPSKEALLEALAGRFAQQALAQVQDVLDDPGLDALARLNAFLARSWRKKIETANTSWALFETLYRPDNFVLFHRINAAAGALFAPLLVKIIAQGVKEGTFDTFDPAGVADMLYQLGGATHGIVARAIAAGSTAETNNAIRLLDQRISLYGIALDRILGLPDGSVRLVEPGLVRAVMMARRRTDPGPSTKPRLQTSKAKGEQRRKS
jgi:AcrR family transcriptional regulator